MKKILHFLGFHGIENLEDTGEYELRFDSPFNLWPTKYEFYKCCVCKRIEKIPPGNFDDMFWDYKVTEAKLKIAKEWKKRGNLEKAIEVLKV